MGGYKLQGKTYDGTKVDIPLVATYDGVGHDLQNHYAKKTDYSYGADSRVSLLEKESRLLEIKINKVRLKDCSWEIINLASTLGRAPSLFRVGDEKEIELATGEVITMVILGFNHDPTWVSGGDEMAGITFGMKDCLVDSYLMGDISWEKSNVRDVVNEEYYYYLPWEVQDVIKPIVHFMSKPVQDYLFLPSHKEVMGTTDFGKGVQGSADDNSLQYAYFKNAPIPGLR